MQGQDHGTITLATPHPGRPKPLTSHPIKVARAPSQDNYPPKFLSFQHSLLIALPRTTSCVVRWSICWFSVRAVCSDFYANATSPFGAKLVVTVCYCHQVVLCLLCIYQDLQMPLAADTRVRFLTCPKCHIPAGILNLKLRHPPSKLPRFSSIQQIKP